MRYLRNLIKNVGEVIVYIKKLVCFIVKYINKLSFSVNMWYKREDKE